MLQLTLDCTMYLQLILVRPCLPGLYRRDRHSSSAVELVNTRPKQFQGEIKGSKSSDQLQNDFKIFFSTTIFKRLGSVAAEDRNDLYDRICKKFQVQFYTDRCTEYPL